VTVRVLIADDQALVRGALAALLALENDLEACVVAGLNIIVTGGTQAARYPRYCRQNGPPARSTSVHADEMTNEA
jgi:DNA-binding NarL/FixJ family response regulator